MPQTDFMALVMHLKEKYADLEDVNGKIIGLKQCSHYKVGLITLKIAGLYYKIPQKFFATEIEDSKCLFMFENNDEFEKKKDDIVTDKGVSDYETNNGYILGTPFLRAFLVLFDFKENMLGFATKYNHFGAFITDRAEDDEAPSMDYKPYDPDELQPGEK